MSDEFVISSGRIVDAAGERFADVVVRDGYVVAVGPDLSASRTLSAGGCVVSPGLVDLDATIDHRDDVQGDHTETTGDAAARGGYTTVVLSPHSAGGVDTVDHVLALREDARRSPVRFVISASLTRAQQGEHLVPFAQLVEAGVRLFGDSLAPAPHASLMYRAMEYTAGLDIGILVNAHERSFGEVGFAHEGRWSSLLGLVGVPSEAEDLIVMREIALAQRHRTRLHFRHLSSAQALAIAAGARSAGAALTTEVTPFHLRFDDSTLAAFDPHLRFAPPLRAESDRLALVDGVRSGDVDVIASQHRPHPPAVKDAPFDEAPPGSLSLETALPMALGVGLSMEEVLPAMSWNAAAVAGIDHPNVIQPGVRADLMVFNPEETWTPHGETAWTRRTNLAASGQELKGRVRHTVAGGLVIVRDGEIDR